MKAAARLLVLSAGAIITISLMLTMTLRSSALVQAQGQMGSPEQVLFNSANRERMAQRLQPLRWNTALANAAQQHAQRMAQADTLSHQLPGEEDFKARDSAHLRKILQRARARQAYIRSG